MDRIEPAVLNRDELLVGGTLRGALLLLGASGRPEMGFWERCTSVFLGVPIAPLLQFESSKLDQIDYGLS